MKRLLALLIAVCLIAPASAFWQSRDSNYNKSIGGSPPPSYQGPGDLGFGSVSAWFGFRCYSASYSGNVADIWDAATGSTTETTITCDGSGNLVATSPSAIATTCASGCKVKTLYDQTLGNNCGAATCDVTQASNASRPTFLYRSASCGANANLSCLQCPATPAATPLFAINPLSSTSQIYYTSLVYNASSIGTVQNLVTIGTSTFMQHGTPIDTFRLGDSITTSTVTATDDIWHAAQSTFSNNTSAVNIDGTTTTGLSVGTTAAIGRFSFCAAPSAAQPVTGYIAEFGLWPSTSSFNASALLANQQSFYGGL